MSDGNVLKVEQVALMCVRVTCVMCHVSCVMCVLVTFPNFDNHRFLFATRDTADTQQLLSSALQKFEIKLCLGCDRSDWLTIPHTENIDWSQLS